ncbi:MAG: hypothetical protein NTZ39_05815 [Methanoregula sp.]|nr:hypothetical protein [Methanoregula sp.]
MVKAEEWKDKLVTGKNYRVVTRYSNADGVFIGVGVTSINERQDPVFSSNGVTMMLPWQGIDRLELVE